MYVLMIVTVLLLCMAASMRPHRSQLSEFELQRRLEAQQPGALLEWRRRELYAELMTVRRIVVAFLLVVASALIIAMFGWLWGLLGAFLLTLAYNIIATVPAIRTLAQAQYDRYESGLLGWIDKRRGLIKLFRGASEEAPATRVASRQELLHLVDEADAHIVSTDERKMLHGALEFSEKRIKDHMTPRSVMEVIGANELLGPLVLHDLHKTGHSHFPVLDGDIDHIVGILHLHNLVTLTKKETVTVRDVMEPRVLFIHENQTLGEALSACIKHRRHLLVVINEFRETVGVITIEDAVEQLIGRPIVDDNDNHDDLRAVATRNPRRNNRPDKGSDV